MSPEYQERMAEETAEFVYWVRASVNTYTENMIIDGLEPTYEEYVQQYPEHDHEPLIDIIVAEMERISRLCKGVAV